MSKRYLATLSLVCAAMFPLADASAESSASCSPLSAAQDEIATAGGGKLAPISHEELQFARGLFVASPPVSVYPPGDEAMLATFDDGSSGVLFIGHGQACGKMGLSPTVTKLLFALDKSI